MIIRKGRSFLSKVIVMLRSINQKPMLEMLWPEGAKVSEPYTLPEQYKLRTYTASDRDSYLSLFKKVDMGVPPLKYWQNHILPEGFFVIEDLNTKEIVAACFASHHPKKNHPYAGNLGWLAVDPEHRGQNLGKAIVAAVTNKLISTGYDRIYLETHDHRLPAILTYLKLGWEPYLYLPDMGHRWKNIFTQLNWTDGRA